MAKKVICPTLMPAIGTRVQVAFGSRQNWMPGTVVSHGEQSPIVEFVLKNGTTRQGPCTVQVAGFQLYSEEHKTSYTTMKYLAWIVQ